MSTVTLIFSTSKPSFSPLLPNWKTHILAINIHCGLNMILRWFETVFHFPLQLNFTKGLLVCSKRLLLLVDSRWCNNLSTYQLLYSHWHFGCHGNLAGPQIHHISTIQLHFTQKVVGKLPFLLHQSNIKVVPKPLDRIFLNFLKKCSLMCKQFWCNKKGSSPTTFCVKCNRMVNMGCIWASV